MTDIILSKEERKRAKMEKEIRKSVEKCGTCDELVCYSKKCEHGHVFWSDDLDGIKDFNEADTKTRFEYVKDLLLKQQEVLQLKIEKLCEDYANLDEDDFLDKYDDMFLDYIIEYGVPEEYCPICNKIKEYEKDEDWGVYLKLKEKFNDINM